MNFEISKLVFLLCITSETICRCCPQSTYYVTPSYNTSCPGQPCQPLSEYVQHFNDFITANTTLVFLPGNHTLSSPPLGSIHIGNVSNLKLGGNSSSLPVVTSWIVCETAGWSFIFENITDLQIHAIGFISCGNDGAEGAVNLDSVSHAELSNCIFQENVNAISNGGALAVNGTHLDLMESRFVGNSTLNGGGVFVSCHSTAVFTQNTFLSNVAAIAGGGVCVSMESSDAVVTFVDNIFSENSAQSTGGGIAITSGSQDKFSTIKSKSLNLTAVIDGNHFVRNIAADSAFTFPPIAQGGGLYVTDTRHLILSRNVFTENSATFTGGGVSANGIVANVYDNTFSSNSALGAGGGMALGYGDPALSTFANVATAFTANSFINNSAIQGGAIAAFTGAVAQFSSCSFLNNSGNTGGGIFVTTRCVFTFSDNDFTANFAEFGGGAIFIADFASANISINNTLEGNRAVFGGGIMLSQSSLGLHGSEITLRDNLAEYGGAIYASRSAVDIKSFGKICFDANIAIFGGAVYVSGSTLEIFGQHSFFVKNSALQGGGLYLAGESICSLSALGTTVHFLNNNASMLGGAVLVDDTNPFTVCFDSDRSSTLDNSLALSQCFYQVHDLDSEFPLLQLNVSFEFKNNTAAVAGADLYGGSINNCEVTPALTSLSSSALFQMIVQPEEQLLDITSDALQVCRCNESNSPNCSQIPIEMNVYPGEQVRISAIALGQNQGPVPATILTQFSQGSNISFRTEVVGSVNTNTACTDIEYTVLSADVEISDRVILFADGPCPKTGRSIVLALEILPCPPGLEFSPNEQICICDNRLQPFTNTCNIDDGTILRPRDSKFWVGYLNDSGLILHPVCTFDYCTEEAVSVSLRDSDIQCDNNRSGLLCGQCRAGFNVAFGTFSCLRCSNEYLSLLLAFAFAGVALVVLLLILKLTVATGAINGLIFYANIVQLYFGVFYPVGNANVLTVFIAWLNLDLGIETCFYNGMDAYDKTWLQFIFPVYIWALMGIVIIASNLSHRLARLFGSNPVAVLATLFLLSYSKILRTISEALSVTFLEFPNENVAVCMAV